MLNLMRRRALRTFALVVMVSLMTAPAVTFAQQPKHHKYVQQAPATGGEMSAPDANSPDKKEEVKDENDEYLHSPMVAKIGSIFHLTTPQAATAFTVFNFLIMAIGVGFVMLKLLPKTIRNRNTQIQKALVDARTATEEATSRLNTVEERLSKLDGQIAGMRQQSEDELKREEQRIKASVEDEKAKIIAAAEAEIHSATAQAQRQIQQYAAELAI
ncbi:MAG: ATP synthase F0 subunit B, partial [Bryocella sp.]